jgi:hypothetical protein
MIEISLDDIPNQKLSIRLDDDFYDITIKETNGCMSFDMVKNNVTILIGIRIVANTLMVPYRYLETGNFVILTSNEDLPYYTEFGKTQNLIYASALELEQIRASI